MHRIKMGLLTFDRNLHVARAYLHALHESGLEVDHVLVCSINSRYGRVRRWAESVLGHTNYLRLREKYRSGKRRNAKYARYCSMIKESSVVRVLAQHPPNIAQYCPRIRYIQIGDTNDPRLLNALRDSGLKHYIFAGLEMFRGQPLHIGTRFLHVHSGLVPNIRGINCFLWNWLYTGKMGYSAIYLDDGVDTGEIVYYSEMPPPCLVNVSRLSEPEQYELFNFLVTYYNQWNKSQVLVQAVEYLISEGYPLHGQAQQSKGRQFYKADPCMIKYFISQLTKASSTEQGT